MKRVFEEACRDDDTEDDEEIASQLAKKISQATSCVKHSWAAEVLPLSIVGSKFESGKTNTQQGRELNKHFLRTTWWENEKWAQNGLLVPSRDPKKLNKLACKQVKDMSGAKWCDMLAQTVTPELKQDLQLVKLRGVLDPKRHYKANDSKGLPKYFQIGTVIEPASEFYSGRLTKKERKVTIADELLSDPTLGQYSY